MLPYLSISFQAGCVHFMNAAIQCDVKILLLIFSPRKRAFVGLIPIDQVLTLETASAPCFAQHEHHAYCRGGTGLKTVFVSVCGNLQHI
jgi:hypothetical protein